MFIETTRRLSQGPDERHMADVAHPDLGKLLRNVFYKHYAPLALKNLGIRQQYQNCARTRQNAADRNSLEAAGKDGQRYLRIDRRY
jgi:hypothetical protein